MREIVVIQLGQCGNQIGQKFWELIAEEHSVSTDGIYRGSSPHQLEKINVYFQEGAMKTYTPRAVLIDLDVGGMNCYKRGYVGRLFSPDSFLTGTQGTGNNWARGYYTDGRQLLDQSMEAIRRHVEPCDRIQGFQLIHSLGGGTGSGMGSALMRRMKDEYPDRIVNTFSVLPSPTMSDIVVEPYNCVLSLNHLVEYSDGTVCLDNEALHRISTRTLKVYKPKYSDLNHLVALAMGGITTGFRLPGRLNADLRKLQVNLVPFPRLHFFCTGYAPLSTSYGRIFNPDDAAGLARQIFDGDNLMAETDPSSGKYLTAAAFFRGPAAGKVVDAALKKYAADFVDFVPNGVKTVICDVPTKGVETSAASLANTTAIQQVFTRILKQFSRMFKRKSSLHWYLGEGMEEEEFRVAADGVQQLISELMRYQDVAWDNAENSNRRTPIDKKMKKKK